MKRHQISNNTRGAWKLFALGLAASTTFLAGTASAQTNLAEYTSYTIADLPPAGFWSAGAITIEDYATLFSQPSAQSAPPTGYTINNAIIFDGAAGGYITLAFDANDTKWAFTGPFSSTAAGSQTLAIIAGNGGTGGDREDVLFATPIPDSGVGQPLSVIVTLNSQSGANTYVNLPATNVFTGPITVQTGSQPPTTGYLVIGGERYEKAFDATHYTAPGSGSLGNGNYAGDISLAAQTALDFNTSANQAMSGVISGAGQVIQEIAGSTLTLSNLNTYTGNTTVSGGTLVVADTGGLYFAVNDTTNTQVTGAGAAIFNGSFTIDTSGVSVSTGPWPLVNVASATYGSTFSVVGFTQSGNAWTLPAGGGNIWVFDTTTGMLYLSGSASILSFGIPGSAGVITGTSIALTVPWNPWGTIGLATLAPTFDLSSGTCNQTSGSPPSPTFAAANPATYTVTDVPTVNNYTVTVTVTPASTAKVMSSVYFPGLGYAAADGTGTNYTLFVAPGTIVTALAPTFTVSQFATASPVSGSTQNFTTPQTYIVTAQDGSQQAYKLAVTAGSFVGHGYQALVLACGPVSYWPLNETSGTIALDIGPAGNNATYGGTFNLGQPGLRADGNLAVGFTGAGQASLPYVGSLNPPLWTVEFWCSVTNLTATYLVAEQDRTAPASSRIGFAFQHNNFSSGWDLTYGSGTPGTPAYSTISSGTPVVAGGVYYVVGSYDGSTVKLYVNGALVNSSPLATYEPAQSSAPGFSMGSRNGSNGGTGLLQDVAVYNRALTQQEITTHYENAPIFTMSKSGANLVFSWIPSGGGTLQTNSVVTGGGGYHDVTGATSPTTNAPTGGNKFYRVKF